MPPKGQKKLSSTFATSKLSSLNFDPVPSKKVPKPLVSVRIFVWENKDSLLAFSYMWPSEQINKPPAFDVKGKSKAPEHTSSISRSASEVRRDQGVREGARHAFAECRLALRTV